MLWGDVPRRGGEFSENPAPSQPRGGAPGAYAQYMLGICFDPLILSTLNDAKKSSSSFEVRKF